MTPPIDVRPDHLRRVKTILRAHLPAGVKVFAYGSRAHGRARTFSDLDLCLRAAARLSAHTLSAIDRDLEESDLPYKVDVIDWNAIGPSFRNAIEKDLIEIDLAERAGESAGHERAAEPETDA